MILPPYQTEGELFFEEEPGARRNSGGSIPEQKGRG
jgi:hypothetical protein